MGLDQQSMIDRAFHQLDQHGDRTSPSELNTSLRYDMTNNEEMFAISVDFPGVDPTNIDISVLDDVLTLVGSRQTDTSSYKFKKSFTLDPSVMVEKMTANLENGVLLVSAPKSVKKTEEEIKRIPVTVGKSSASVHESKEEVAKSEEGVSTDEEVINLDEDTNEQKNEDADDGWDSVDTEETN